MAWATQGNMQRSTRHARPQMQRSLTPKLPQQQHPSMQFSISYHFLPVALALYAQLVYVVYSRQDETGLHGQKRQTLGVYRTIK
jgi:hypothetical protein